MLHIVGEWNGQGRLRLSVSIGVPQRSMHMKYKLYTSVIRIYVLAEQSLPTLIPYHLLSLHVYIASCYDGQIKLIGGFSEIEGRVEICSNQRWETIVQGSWRHEEAIVACNSLGYGYGKNYVM